MHCMPKYPIVGYVRQMRAFNCSLHLVLHSGWLLILTIPKGKGVPPIKRERHYSEHKIRSSTIKAY